MEVDSDCYPWRWERTPEKDARLMKSTLVDFKNVANFFALFIVTLFIEILNMRKLYTLSSLYIGFAFGNLNGTVAGMAVDLFPFVLCLKLPK